MPSFNSSPWMRGAPQSGFARDPEQCQGRPLRAPATLFPVSERVHAYSERVCKLLLGQAHEASKSDDIFASSKASAQNALTLFPRNRAREVAVGQFTSIALHPRPPSNCSLRCRSFLVAMRALMNR